MARHTPLLEQRLADDDLQLGVETAQFVIRPADEGLVNGWVQAHQDRPPLAARAPRGRQGGLGSGIRHDGISGRGCRR